MYNQLLALETDQNGTTQAQGSEDEYNPMKRGLSRQLAIMLLDELFPNLKDATLHAKGEFLFLLTGFNAKGLSTKWGDYNVGTIDYEGDQRSVAYWKKRLKVKN